MAKSLTRIHVHTQYAHRRPKKVYRQITRVQPLRWNSHRFSRTANVIYNHKVLRVYLDANGQWHGYPFAGEPEVEVVGEQ